MDDNKQRSATLEIASILTEGVQDEADTNKMYLRNLARIIEIAEAAQLDGEAIALIEATYKEIMEDELNHAQRFFALSNQISGLVPSAD